MHNELPDFDTLLRMEETNPDGLEELRQDLTQQLITNAPESIQRRLKGLQFQIDAQRRIAGSPMAACIKISQMMHESLFSLRETLNNLTIISKENLDVNSAYATATCKTLESAEVLKFGNQRIAKAQRG